MSYISENYIEMLLESPEWMKTPPHEHLGVDKNASDAEVKKAYLKMAKKYHPDINKAPDAVEKMQAINWAKDNFRGTKHTSSGSRHGFDSEAFSRDFKDAFAKGSGFDSYEDMEHANKRGFYSSKQWNEAKSRGAHTNWDEFIHSKYGKGVKRKAAFSRFAGPAAIIAIYGTLIGLAIWRAKVANQREKERLERLKHKFNAQKSSQRRSHA